MKTYIVTEQAYNYLRTRLAGYVFHRISDTGVYLIKCLKCVDHIVSAAAIGRVLLLLTLLFTACAKEQQQVLILGSKYHLRGDVFNDGAYQPEQPLTLIDLYEANGTPYAHCRARVDWTKFALKGVADQTIAANKLHAKQYGDTTTLTWAVPQWDLK